MVGASLKFSFSFSDLFCITFIFDLLIIKVYYISSFAGEIVTLACVAFLIMLYLS